MKREYHLGNLFQVLPPDRSVCSLCFPQYSQQHLNARYPMSNQTRHFEASMLSRSSHNLCNHLYFQYIFNSTKDNPNSLQSSIDSSILPISIRVGIPNCIMHQFLLSFAEIKMISGVFLVIQHLLIRNKSVGTPKGISRLYPTNFSSISTIFSFSPLPFVLNLNNGISYSSII